MPLGRRQHRAGPLLDGTPAAPDQAGDEEGGDAAVQCQQAGLRIVAGGGRGERFSARVRAQAEGAASYQGPGRDVVERCSASCVVTVAYVKFVPVGPVVPPCDHAPSAFAGRSNTYPFLLFEWRYTHAS